MLQERTDLVAQERSALAGLPHYERDLARQKDRGDSLRRLQQALVVEPQLLHSTLKRSVDLLFKSLSENHSELVQVLAGTPYADQLDCTPPATAISEPLEGTALPATPESRRGAVP